MNNLQKYFRTALQRRYKPYVPKQKTDYNPHRLRSDPIPSPEESKLCPPPAPKPVPVEKRLVSGEAEAAAEVSRAGASNFTQQPVSALKKFFEQTWQERGTAAEVQGN